MIALRHCGIYVKDINREETFYEKVFNMSYICRQQISNGDFDFLLNCENSKVLITKLITEYGAKTGIGDMIELINVVSPYIGENTKYSRLYDIGTMHFALECDFNDVIPKVEQYDGKISVEPHKMKNNNLMAFVQDPEGNFIELIERRNRGGVCR